MAIKVPVEFDVDHLQKAIGKRPQFLIKKAFLL